MQSIFDKFGIDTYAYISADLCKKANERLYSSLPDIGGLNAVFMLFPYYVKDAGQNISKYACVHDYHSFAKTVFSSLDAYMEENFPNSFHRGFSDHSPIAEVHGAALAGLGVLGKHSLLINEKYSSYAFIGTYITSLSSEELSSMGIPKGEGIVNYCIGCNACARACPRSLCGTDSRDGCISDVTQKKGELSESEREIILSGESIWGCDICQDACPYTKRAIESDSIYTPIEFFRSSFIEADICERIKSMNKEEFEKYPFAWRKRATVTRNIEILKGEEK